MTNKTLKQLKRDLKYCQDYLDSNILSVDDLPLMKVYARDVVYLNSERDLEILTYRLMNYIDVAKCSKDINRVDFYYRNGQRGLIAIVKEGSANEQR